MDHSIEPELASPVPRKTRFRDEGASTGAIAYRFVMVLLIGLGLALFIYFCLQLSIGFTAPAEGSIVGFRARAAQPGGEPYANRDTQAAGGTAAALRTPIMDYRFRVDGQDLTGSAQVDQAQVELLPQDFVLRVRYVPFLALQINRPVFPNDMFWGTVGILGVITLVAEVLIGTLCWFAFALPNRQRALCRMGKPGVATVIRKEVWGGGANGYIVHYRFEPKPDKAGTASPRPSANGANAEKPGAEVLGEMRVPQAFWEDLNDGDKLTVLYSPADPNTSMLYKPSAFAAVSSTYADRSVHG